MPRGRGHGEVAQCGPGRGRPPDRGRLSPLVDCPQRQHRLAPRPHQAGLIDGAAEDRLAADWRRRIGIRTPDMDDNILTLSGGNQQKALFARALGTTAPIVLMDDPMRGVDVGTKREVYAMIRAEADGGRTFVWYTTEMDELQHCGHVYVFRDGRIVADLPRHEATEEAVLHASFQEPA